MNIEGTLNILQSALEMWVWRVVHSLTSEVYGTAHYVPIDEQYLLVVKSPYATTKIESDKLVDAFYR
jgi:dTDP-glucose 4,6-dehydratase